MNLRNTKVLLLLFLFCLGGYAQENTGSVDFYLNCEDCDLDFVRQELNFVSFVRDPLFSDVLILVTHSDTGSGGQKYFLHFIGKKTFAGMENEYVVTTNSFDADDAIRRNLIQAFKVGILQYYLKTGFIDDININIESRDNQKADEMVIDPWNKWIFSIETGGEFQKEESQNEYSLTTEGKIQKTTEEWKGGIAAVYELNREHYFDEGTRISNKQDTKELSARYIKSLTNKWSARIYGEYASRSYINIKHKYSTAAALEYNIFPWNESHKRVLAIRCNLAATSQNYHEETIYDKMKENLVSGSLEVHMGLKQPWGQLYFGLEGSHYFHDFSKNRLSLESDFSIFISKNVSVFFEIESDMIHDQLYLPKGDISLEDLLLKRRKLATTYEVSGEVGFRFIFGSIYNNIVNERF